MKANSSATAQRVLDWVSIVLQERFGQEFVLKLVNSDGFGSEIEMSIAGEPGSICMMEGMEWFDRDGSTLPCSNWNCEQEGWRAPLGSELPSPGLDCGLAPVISKQEFGFRVRYPVVAMVWWMLSRREEVGRTDLDHHERFPATASHAFHHGYLDRPIVDEWLEILRQIIKRLWPNIKLKAHRFQMKVSHDVDRPSTYGFLGFPQMVKRSIGNSIRRKNLLEPFAATKIWLASRKKLHKDDRLNTFDWIMDVSEQHGLCSAFYFICGRTDAARDSDYEIEDAPMRELLRCIHERGHEIGLHPSYNTWLDPRALADESARLKRVCAEERIEQTGWGGRMHYLRWQHPTTMNRWEHAGMDYDSTLGFADRPGFRCGTCFEYPAFDPVAGKMLDLRIRPLIAMDCSVTSPIYMGLGTGREARDAFLKLKAACAAVNGTFTLLWHNSEFITAESRRLYTDVVSSEK